MGLEPTTFCMASGSWVRLRETANPHEHTQRGLSSPLTPPR